MTRETACLDEQTLLRQARALDEAALNAIFEMYYDKLYRYIYHHTGSVPVAQELASDVFQRFLEALHDGRAPDHYLQAWLYRVAHNLTVDHLRKQEHRQHEPLSYELESSEQPVGQQAQRSILQDHAREALEHLTEKQRAAISLRYLEGLTNEEVARVLNASVGAVKALQHRGLRAMRRHLAKIGVITEDES